MFRCLSMCSLLSGSHFTHTPHPHHNTSTHHTQSSPLTHYHRLVLAHASLRWHTVLYSVPVDARCALIKSTQIKPSYIKPYPHKYNYKDTHKDAHKYATTDTTSAIRTNTQLYRTHTTNTPTKQRPQIHLQRNYSVHVTMLHGNMVNTPTNTPTNTHYGSITLSPQKGPPSPGRGGGGSKFKYNEGGGGVHRGRELGCPLGELPLHQGKGSPA